jgi:hypothetical protein
MSKQGLLTIAVLLGLLILSPVGRIPKANAAASAEGPIVSGMVRDSAGAPVAGAMITREIDFDEQGRIWTSNSNIPAWQIEGGLQAVIRLDPDGSDDLATHLAAAAAPQRRPAATVSH